MISKTGMAQPASKKCVHWLSTFWCSKILLVVLPWMLIGVYQQQVAFCQNVGIWSGLGDGTTWHDAANWESGQVPADGDGVLFFSPIFIDLQLNQDVVVSEALNLTVMNLEMNANFSTLGMTFGGGSLNLNNHVYTGGLILGSSLIDNSPAEVLRNGGVLNLAHIDLIPETGALGVTLDLLASDSISDLGSGTLIRSNIDSNGLLNIQGASVFWDGRIDGGTVNLQSGTVAGTTQVNSGGALNITGGTLSGDLSLGSNAGSTPTFTRSGGTLNLGSLAMLNGGQITIGQTDNVTESINIAAGSELIVNRELELTGELRVQENSKVFLNENLVAQSLVYGGDSLVRGDGVSVNVDLLDFRSTEYTYDGTDSFARAIRVDDGQLNINLAASSEAGFVNASNGSTVNVNAETSIGSGGFGIGNSVLNINADTNARVIASGQSVVNINADLNSGPLLRANGSTVNLNAGTIRGPLELLEQDGSASTFNRSVESSLILTTLDIQGETHLDFVEGDSFVAGSGRIRLADDASLNISSSSLVAVDDRIDVSSNSRLLFEQSMGQLDGLETGNLTIDAMSEIALVFDEVLAAEDELDFALRLTFDHTSLLQGYLDAGLITVSGPNSAQISVIRDTALYGDYTYVGYVGIAAVPEPGCAMVLALSLGIFLRRTRFES